MSVDRDIKCFGLCCGVTYNYKIEPFSAKLEVKSPSLNGVSTAIQGIMLDKL